MSHLSKRATDASDYSAAMPLKLATASTVLVCLLASTAAQDRPDLSGTWAAATDAPQGVEAAPSPVFGARFGIKQTATEVTLTRVGRDGAFPLTLALDGTELRWRVAGQLCQGDSERTEKAGFEGKELVYTLVGMTPPGGGQSRVSNVKYRIRPAGPGRPRRAGDEGAAGAGYSGRDGLQAIQRGASRCAAVIVAQSDDRAGHDPAGGMDRGHLDWHERNNHDDHDGRAVDPAGVRRDARDRAHAERAQI